MFLLQMTAAMWSKRSITLQTTSDRVLDVSKIEIDKSAACADDTGYVGEYIDSSVFFQLQVREKTGTDFLSHSKPFPPTSTLISSGC